jgi:hypothetical protein
MGRIVDAILGRSTRAPSNLDALFALPNAAITLQSTLSFTMTGKGSVCYRASDGPAFAQTIHDVVELLDNDDDPDVELTKDEFGFSWLLVEQQDLSDLVTDLHAVNTSLEAQGFADGLLCSLVTFKDNTGRSLGLVYLYKKGTFYPFAPREGRQRDNLLELQVKELLKKDLRIEPELASWMALWGAPGL